jgi:glycosyltransferase involved in cell wall biosynthesis
MLNSARHPASRRQAIPGARIRVHFFFRRAVPGEHFSIERLFRTIARALPVERYEIRFLICPFESKGVVRRAALVIWAAFKQGDINHITGDVNFLGLLMSRRRTILTLHDSASMERLRGWRRFFYDIFWLQLPIRRAARVTAVSRATLEETARHVPPARSRLAVVPNCVTGDVRLSRRPSLRLRPRILAVGTKPNKNLMRVLEALRVIQCRLVVVGSLAAGQAALIAQAGLDVENHPTLDDMEIANQYSAADLVLFVPTYEGFGLPILEAQAAGRPLITSRRAPMEEVAGEGSCLVDPEDVGEIREAVLRVINDDDYRESLVQAGLRNVQQYAPDVVAGRYAALYEEMLADSGR